MFGSHRRFVRRCEWLSCLEKYGDFPQISQMADMEVMVPVPPECIDPAPDTAE
jgi:hypothetical protein